MDDKHWDIVTSILIVVVVVGFITNVIGLW